MSVLTEYDFTQQVDYTSVLAINIQASSIVTALDHIGTTGSGPTMIVAVWFKDVLSTGDQTTLISLMASYINTAPPAITPLVVINNALPPFGAKTLVVSGVTHKLFSRFTGFQQSLSPGSNTITYTSTYPWAKLLGVEVINSEALDYVDFKVYDNSSGTYSGVANALLNQFSYSLNIPKDYYQRNAQFDADIYVGMIIQITYTSVSAKTVGFNLFLNQVV